MNYFALSYYTIYKAKILASNDVIFETIDFWRKPCFRLVYEQLKNPAFVYEGIYTIQCNKENSSYNNYCILSKKQIITLLKYLRINYKIKTKLKETQNSYFITFHIVGKPIKHKWILAWSRAFYEAPFNLFARDVFRLRELKSIDGIYFANQDFFKLYTICAYSSSIGLGRDSSLWYCTQLLMSKQDIWAKLNANTKLVWDVIDTPRTALTSFSAYRTNWDKLDSTRISVYCNNYKTITNETKNFRSRTRN
jgi:hypothetical protein